MSTEETLEELIIQTVTIRQSIEVKTLTEHIINTYNKRKIQPPEEDVVMNLLNTLVSGDRLDYHKAHRSLTLSDTEIKSRDPKVYV